MFRKVTGRILDSLTGFLMQARVEASRPYHFEDWVAGWVNCPICGKPIFAASSSFNETVVEHCGKQHIVHNNGNDLFIGGANTGA